MLRDDSSDSFVRWQAITIGQLTYAINLILGFSVATLGFQLSLLQSSDFNPVSWGKCIFSISLICLFSSMLFGVWVVINRLKDFRLTMRTARKREAMLSDKKTEEEIDRALEPYRISGRELGESTWVLFWWQIGTFGAGVLFTTLSVLISFGQKLL